MSGKLIATIISCRKITSHHIYFIVDRKLFVREFASNNLCYIHTTLRGRLFANVKGMLKVLSNTSQIDHSKHLRNIQQLTNEPANNLFAWLQLKASCCGFTSTHCDKVAVKHRVKEQFVYGLANKTVRTAILKTGSFNPETLLDKLLAELSSRLLTISRI